MTYKNKHKDSLILYDLEGNVLAKKLFTCRGCAKKHAPKTTPACIQDHEGNVIWSNAYYARMKHKVKK